MRNLLQETLDVLKENNKTKEDIEWIGCRDFYITWENFEEIANVEYDSSYGAPKVATDLIVAGKDFWLEREEYYGSELWAFRTLPIQPEISTKLKSLTVEQANKIRNEKWFIGWDTLNSLNEIIK